MRRWFLFSLTLVLALGLAAGCATKQAAGPETAPAVGGEPAAAPTPPPPPAPEPTPAPAPEQAPSIEGGVPTGDMSGTSAVGAAPQAAATVSEAVDVFFAFDDFSLTPEAKDILSKDAEYLKAFPAVRLKVEGHCDERGTSEYNLGLGERRAASARSYLVSLGIDGKRLETVSFGKEKPFDLGHTEEAWSKNRRAHFVVIK